jgi:hypothetical protein
VSNWPRFYGILQNGWWHGLLLGSIVELLNSLSFLSLAPLLRTTVVPSHGQQPLQQPPDWSKASPPGIAATTRESRPATLAFPFPQVSIFKPPPPPNLLQTTQPETRGGARFTPSLITPSTPPLLSCSHSPAFHSLAQRSLSLTLSPVHSSCLYRIFIYLSYLCVYIYIYC